jgi:hypothetical protein
MERIRHILPRLAPLAAVLLALAACGGQPGDAPTDAGTSPAAPASAPATVASAPAPAEVGVAGVTLGSAVDDDQRITTPTERFAPGDTIYAAIATTGSGSAKLDAHWTYQDGQTVNEESATIAPEAPASTAFHISKPGGFPAGAYKVDISLDGKPVASKAFTVK